MNIFELVFVAVSAVVLLSLAVLLLQSLFKISLRQMITDHNNHAYGIAASGYVFGISWTMAVLLRVPGGDVWWQNVLDVILYGAVGIVLLTLVGLLSCRIYLGLQVREQLEEHNTAAGVVVGAVFVATSFTYSGALSGEGGALWTLLLFFVIGQIALLCITHVYRWLTGYDDIAEIAGGNVAAALALAGLLIAVGMIVAAAAAGVYTTLTDSVTEFFIALAVVIAFYPIRQVVVQSLMLGGRLAWRSILLDKEISEDENIAAGTLEATAYVASALFLIQLM